MSTANVSAEEVAKSYLVAELSKILPGESSQKELEQNIAQMKTKDMWRMLEAMSFTYRLNGIFWAISDDGLLWSREEIDCSGITLTGMSPQIDKVTHSDNVGQNPIKFRDYLIEYFKKHSNDEHEGLSQFRSRKIEIKHSTIIVLEKEDKLLILDGSNRLMAHLLSGEDDISAYVGRRSRPGKMRLGDSTFWLLRRVYEKGGEPTKKAVLTVVKELIKASSDGKNAVKTYWISHARDETLKKVGKELIDENS